MRVITGTARGRRLMELEGQETRPTTDRVKEGLFSALQFEIEGAKVLDLFAGTGQLGIECLSRGAASATFVDMRGDAVALVKKKPGVDGPCGPCCGDQWKRPGFRRPDQRAFRPDLPGPALWVGLAGGDFDAHRRAGV